GPTYSGVAPSPCGLRVPLTLSIVREFPAAKIGVYTTHSREPGRHRAADDGVGHHTPARPLDHLAIIGPVLPGQTRPPRLPPWGALSRLCSPGAAEHGRAGTHAPVVG